MICQQCGFNHSNQFIVCPECNTYQFRSPSLVGSLVLSFLLAALLFGLTLFAIKLGVNKFSLADMLYRHWINDLILFVSYWGIFIILGKMVEYFKQRKAIKVFFRPEVMSILSKKGALSPVNFHHTIHEIRECLTKANCNDVTDYIVFDLIRKTLYHLESIQQKEEINEILAYHSQLSQSKLEEEFVMLKVLYWAIPILGFIGTVMGVGNSIGAFSDFISSGADTAGLKSSLVEVTKGLAIAFDSTLIALAFAVIILPLGTFIENQLSSIISQSEEYALSFITPFMDFPIDDKSPAGILKRNIESMSIQTKYLQDFMVEFTSFCNRNSRTEKETDTDSDYIQSDGDITEEVIDTGTGILPEGMKNTDSYPTEAMKAVSDTDLIHMDNSEVEKNDGSKEIVEAPPLMDDENSGEVTDDNEATLLETLINEKEDQEQKGQ